MTHTRRFPGARRAGIYVAVLATATIVTVIGLASMAAWRVQGAAANAAVDSAEAKLYAEAAVDDAAYCINTDPSWRTNRSQGAWRTNVAFAHGACSISGVDPVDGDFTNRPYDPVVLTCTGNKGNATHITTVTLQPQGVPIPALAMALHTAGQIRINGGTLTATGAPVSTNACLRLDGNITGSAQCLLSVSALLGTGTVSGGITFLAPAKAMPPSGILAMYKNLATAIAPGSTMSKQVLAPGVNTIGGGLNADGLYYISTSSDLAISNCRINGTLVIDCPGKTVTISSTVFMSPARPDYPVLIVNGMLTIQTTGAALSEVTNSTNFNPAGAPYQGVADSDMLDTYPGEIQGLVHCTDKLTITGSSIIRGAVICESTDGTQAVYTDNTPQIIYDPTLFTNPPMGYTSGINMKVVPGSWRQTVLP